MKTTIGINIVTRTAVEHNRLMLIKNSGAYYEDYYMDIGKFIYSTIEDYPVNYWNITSSTAYQDDGSVVNAIIFELYHSGGIEKSTLKDEIENKVRGYVDEKLKR